MMPAHAPHGVQPRKPPRHVVLPPSAFASDWGSAPAAEVAVGLRFVSAEDERIARATAVAKATAQIAPKGKVLDQRAFNEAYNDEVILCLVARCICDPNDIARPFELLPAAEDQIPRAMSSQGVRRLWDEFGLLHAGHGIAIPVATDDDASRLSRILRRSKALADMAGIAPAHAVEARKLVSSLLERLSVFDDGGEPEPAADGEDEVAVYDTGA